MKVQGPQLQSRNKNGKLMRPNGLIGIQRLTGNEKEHSVIAAGLVG